MPIIRSSRVLYRWLLPMVFGAVKMENVICRLGRLFFFHVQGPKRIIMVHCRRRKKKNLPNLQITFSIFTAPNTTGSNHLYNTLELLMMGILVPETC